MSICCRQMRLFSVLDLLARENLCRGCRAVESLKKREVERIILSRPAVEAGERLGVSAWRHEGKGRSVSAPAL